MSADTSVRVHRSLVFIVDPPYQMNFSNESYCLRKLNKKNNSSSSAGANITFCWNSHFSFEVESVFDWPSEKRFYFGGILPHSLLWIEHWIHRIAYENQIFKATMCSNTLGRWLGIDIGTSASCHQSLSVRFWSNFPRKPLFRWFNTSFTVFDHSNVFVEYKI